MDGVWKADPALPHHLSGPPSAFKDLGGSCVSLECLTHTSPPALETEIEGLNG